MDNVLITTTVSLDVNTEQPLMVIHLVQGNYGTRALRLVPVDSGRLMDLSGVATASVGMSCVGHDNLEIDCEVDERYVTLVPTQAMTEEADEWLCQLNLMDAGQNVLSSAPFRIIVHGSVYDGDAVEHTNSGVTAVVVEADGKITLEKMDGETVTSGTSTFSHTHAEATSDAAGFMPAGMFADVAAIQDKIDQAVKTTSEVEFSKITVGTIVIDSETGEISGAKFT